MRQFKRLCWHLVMAGCALAAPSMAAQAKTPEQPGISHLPRVHLDGTYFTRNGRRFIPVGAHWVPAKAAMQWPVEWDPKDIEADFAKMHELGYSIVRFDMVWPWFEPRPGDYNPVAFQQLDYLVSLGHKYQIYLHPSLFIGGEVGEAYWDVPWRHGRHPHADPEMLRLEPFQAPGGRLFAPAQVALDAPVQPAATACPHHDPVEDILLGDLEHVLKDAELRPVLAEHRDARGDTLIGDRELLVVVHTPTIAE